MPRVKAQTKVKVPALLANGDDGDAVVSSTTTSINEVTEEQPVKAVSKGRGRGKKVAAEQLAAPTEDVKAVTSKATTSGRGRKKALMADVQEEISEEPVVNTKAVSKARGKKAVSKDLGGDTADSAAAVPVTKTAANRRKKAEASKDEVAEAEVAENNIGDTNVIAVQTTKKSSTGVGKGRKKNVAEGEPVETEVAVKLEVETEEKAMPSNKRAAAAKKIKVEIDAENSIDTQTANPADNKSKTKKTSKTTKSKKDAANGEATEAVVKTVARGRKRAVDAAAEIIDEGTAEIESPKKKLKKDAVKKLEKKARVTKSKKAAEDETVQDEEESTEAEALSDIATTSAQQKPTKRQRQPKATNIADDQNNDAVAVAKPEKKTRVTKARKPVQEEAEAEEMTEEQNSAAMSQRKADDRNNDGVAVAKPEKKTRVTKAKKPAEEEAKAEEMPEEENSAATSQRKAAAKRPRQRKAIATAADDDQLDEDEVDGAKPSKSKRKAADAAPLNATDTTYNKSDFDLPALEDDSVSEKRYNLKISSWNVAGLRSWLKKDGLKFLEYEEPDIFCMQETKCTTDQLPEEAERIPGYHPYWLCMPGGYAGVAIYSKIMPINVEYGIGNKEFDDVGRMITAEYEKFFLVCVYVPNSGRKLVNLEARMRWEKLFQVHVQKLDARKPVIISGDMNVSHLEIDLANPKTNTRNAGFTKEERDQMSALLALGYVDTFRHLYPQRTGAYTYWTYMANARARNVGWRLDYFLVSERYRKRVVDNCIRAQCKGSDHCPITLFLNL